MAAGGLVGPSIAGAGLLAASRRRSRARVLLYAVGGAMLLTVPLFTRGLFAPIFVLGMAGAILAAARWLPEAGRAFAIQLIGVQLCLAVFRDVGYMFSEGGYVGGQLHRSDSAAIAEALLLPYWFWGALTAVVSLAALAVGLWWSLRPRRGRA